MIEDREAVCLKNIDTAETPEIHQKELEMIQTSKQLLTQIISTGKIPQDIVEDKVTNEEDDSNYENLEDDSLEIDANDQADGNDQAGGNDQADDNDQAEDNEQVDDSAQAKDVDGAEGNEADDIQSDKVQDNQEHGSDDLEIDEENAHGNNAVAVSDEAESATGLLTEDVLTQAETDDGLLTQARSQYETEDEIADYQVAFDILNLIYFAHEDFN